MSRLKVVRLLPQLDYGGAESLLVMQSALMDREAFDFRVCTFWKAGAAAQAIQELGVDVDILQVDPSIKNPRALASLYQYLRHHQPDVLHASIGECMFHGAIAGALAGVPLRIIEEVGIPDRSPKAQKIFYWVSHLAHRVVGVSEATCDYLLHKEHISPDRVLNVPNCGKPPYFEPISRDYTREGRRFRFFTAGRLEPVKNQKALIHAMADVVKTNPDVEFWIAGAGSLDQTLTDLIESLDMQDHISMLGYRNDVKALLSQCDVFVMSSYTEGLSVAMIEAMATGAPVLGSSAGGITEIMGALGEQYVVEPDDHAGWVAAMSRMVRMTPEALEAHGQAGKTIAFDSFSPTTYINRIQTLYRTGDL